MPNIVLSKKGRSHINHLFENFNLTFRELKSILKQANDGQLKATEKIDGFNIYVSFSDNEVRIARNKSELKQGGIGERELRQKKFSSDDIAAAFIKAYGSLEKAFFNIDSSSARKIFADGQIFYNMELVSPEVNNVLQYNNGILSFHNHGHAVVTPEGDIRTDIDISDAVEELKKSIPQMEGPLGDDDYKIQQTAFYDLRSVLDKDPYKEAAARIESLMKEHNLSDSNRIVDYVKSSLYKMLADDEPFTNLPQDYQEFAVDCVVGIRNLHDMPPNTPPEIKQVVREYSKTKSKGELERAIESLQEIIHDFSVELLGGMHSAYVLNPTEEVQRIQKELIKAIKAIKLYDGSGSVKAKDILVKQLKKIKNIENVNSSLEGLVFAHNGILYKITGNFAPINQILNIYNYGRGDIPPLKNKFDEKELEEGFPSYGPAMFPLDPGQNANPDDYLNQEEHVEAIYPGGFKPPHAGHHKVVQELLAEKVPEGASKYRKVVIIISRKPRIAGVEGEAKPITAEMSKKIWEIYTENDSDRLEIRIAEEPTPVQAAYEYLGEMPAGSKAVVIKSSKDENDRRFDMMQDFSDKNQFEVEVEQKIVREMANKITGRQMRHFIATNNKEAFMNFTSDAISTEDREECWRIVNNRSDMMEYQSDVMIDVDDAPESPVAKLRSEVEKMQAEIEKLRKSYKQKVLEVEKTSQPDHRWILYDKSRIKDDNLNHKWSIYTTDHGHKEQNMLDFCQNEPDYEKFWCIDAADENKPISCLFLERTMRGYCIKGFAFCPKYKNLDEIYDKTAELLQKEGWYCETNRNLAEILVDKGLKPIENEQIIKKCCGDDVKTTDNALFYRNLGPFLRVKRYLFGYPKFSKFTL
jgi:hypothetical protein